MLQIVCSKNCDYVNQFLRCFTYPFWKFQNNSSCTHVKLEQQSLIKSLYQLPRRIVVTNLVFFVLPSQQRNWRFFFFFLPTCSERPRYFPHLPSLWMFKILQSLVLTDPKVMADLCRLTARPETFWYSFRIRRVVVHDHWFAWQKKTAS